MKEYVKRKSSRLKNYNYSQSGAYFLTICTKDRKMLLGLIESGLSPAETPWFGQLMAGPQMLAYLIQINLWMQHYKIAIEIA